MKALCVASLVFAVASSAFAAGASEEEGIKKALSEFEAAWNKHDAKEIAASFGDDSSLINPAGISAKGRADIEKVVAQDLANIIKDSASKFTFDTAHFVKPDVAFVDCWHEITPKVDGAKPMKLHVDALMVKKGKKWVIEDARPHPYVTAPAGGPA